MTGLDKQIFDCGLQIKRLMYSPATPAGMPPESISADSKGVKLPKLDVPTFDGDLLNWQTFWEQFCVAVHDRSNISDAEKLVYLRNSLKDGPAKGVIEGLSRSGEHYNEAIECLRSHSDRPRLIHQMHVKRIMEIPLAEAVENLSTWTIVSLELTPKKMQLNCKRNFKISSPMANSS